MLILNKTIVVEYINTIMVLKYATKYRDVFIICYRFIFFILLLYVEPLKRLNSFTIVLFSKIFYSIKLLYIFMKRQGNI